MQRLLATALLACATAGHAASFDCARAHAPDERAICADRALNDQDVRMDILLDINSHAQIMGANGAMRDDQREWLQLRHRCGADRACLARVYRTRVDALYASARAYAEHNR